MTPRVDVVALSIPLTVDAVTRAVRESGHSCFPVCGDNLDDLIGVLFVNDLFRAGWKVGGIGDTGCRQTGPPGVTRAGTGEPSGRAAADAGPDRHLAAAPPAVPGPRVPVWCSTCWPRCAASAGPSPWWSTSTAGSKGVLTVKDLLGALVGDLPDEFDPDDEPDVVRVDASRWLVDGRMSVDDVRDRLDINLPEGEYVTLGGFLFDGFGHIPARASPSTSTVGSSG